MDAKPALKHLQQQHQSLLRKLDTSIYCPLIHVMRKALLATYYLQSSKSSCALNNIPTSQMGILRLDVIREVA